MQKTGTITNIAPDGGYPSQNGYINTFQMTIQCPDGVFTGQIGSKSQTYPLAIGSSISVEVTNTEHGVRFKRFNPQYAGQQRPVGRSQASSRPTEQPNANKDRLIVAQVVYKAMAKKNSLMPEFDLWLMGDGKNVFKRHVDLIMKIGSGKAMLNPLPNTAAYRPNPDYVGEGGTGETPPDDNIPY